MLGGLPDGVLLTIGLILLVSGGELVVQGSIRIAGLLGMPSFLVGFTLVAIGTSLPELGVVLNAINRGSPEAVDLAVGGVIGSNIANVMLVLAIAMLIGAASQPDKDLKQDALMLLAATTFVVLSVVMGEFPAWLGVLSISSMGVLCLHFPYEGATMVMKRILGYLGATHMPLLHSYLASFW